MSDVANDIKNKSLEEKRRKERTDLNAALIRVFQLLLHKKIVWKCTCRRHGRLRWTSQSSGIVWRMFAAGSLGNYFSVCLWFLLANLGLCQTKSHAASSSRCILVSTRSNEQLYEKTCTCCFFGRWQSAEKIPNYSVILINREVFLKHNESMENSCAKPTLSTRD